MSYTKYTTWADNVKNCRIDETRAVMVSDDSSDVEFCTFEAGLIISRLGIDDKTVSLHQCGRWHWISFEQESDAIAFKIVWEQ